MTSRPLTSFFFRAFLVVFVWTGVGFAEGGADDARRLKARALMEQAFAANEAGDKSMAHDLYLKSFELYPSYDVAGNLGDLEVEFGRYLIAAEHLEYCLRNFPSGESLKLKSFLQGRLEEARKYVGGVTISVDEPGVKILLDGAHIGTSPMEREVFVMAGEHTIRAKSPEGEAEVTFLAEKNETVAVELILQPRSVEEGPPSSAGDATINDEEPQSKKNWVPAYVLGGVTVAVFGTSMVFRGMAGAQKSKVEDLRPDEPDGCVGVTAGDCADLRSAIDKHNTFGRVSNATLIGAGVGAALTVGYVGYLLFRKDRDPDVGATVGIDPQGGTVLFFGRF